MLENRRLRNLLKPTWVSILIQFMCFNSFIHYHFDSLGTKLNFNSDKLFNNIEPEKNTNKRSVPSEPVALVSDVSKSQDTSGVSMQ